MDGRKPSEENFYLILGVTKSSSNTQIKKAYYDLARQNHPDKNPGDNQAEERFKEISVAYEVLSDKTKRDLYDDYLRRFGHDQAKNYVNAETTTNAEVKEDPIIAAREFLSQLSERVNKDSQARSPADLPAKKSRLGFISSLFSKPKPPPVNPIVALNALFKNKDWQTNDASVKQVFNRAHMILSSNPAVKSHGYGDAKEAAEKIKRTLPADRKPVNLSSNRRRGPSGS